MFNTEDELQQLVHEQPELILSGIPEINPAYCPDTPMILSLRREIPTRSGFIDNLYIDTNGVITLVECKTYSNSGIKREVYSQAINYASDLQNMLIHYSRTEFIEQFYSIISKGESVAYLQFYAVIDQLSKDPILRNRNKDDWKQQFLQRLEFNVKNGVFRIVILCAPSIATSFAYAATRNLMQLMTFSESGNSKYDLILMDLREKLGNHQTQMIWRRYCPLPEIPLLAKRGDTGIGKETTKKQFSELPSEAQISLNRFLDGLPVEGIKTLTNTQGRSLYDSHQNSMYLSIGIENDTWIIRRHQIRKSELLFKYFESNETSAWLTGTTCETLSEMNFKHKVFKKTSKALGLEGTMYELWLYPPHDADMQSLIGLLKSRLSYQPLDVYTFK